MEERLFIGWGYRLLKVLIFLLVIAGIIFLVRLVKSRIPPDLEKHRPQLELLERAYEERRTLLFCGAENKIKHAANEVLAIQYQQELNTDLEDLEHSYFTDRQSILDCDYRVLEDNWAGELKKISQGGEDDADLFREP